MRHHHMEALYYNLPNVSLDRYFNSLSFSTPVDFKFPVYAAKVIGVYASDTITSGFIAKSNRLHGRSGNGADDVMGSVAGYHVEMDHVAGEASQPNSTTINKFFISSPPPQNLPSILYPSLNTTLHHTHNNPLWVWVLCTV